MSKEKRIRELNPYSQANDNDENIFFDMVEDETYRIGFEEIKDKIKSDASIVTSVNNKSGVVTFSTKDMPENINLYYTEERGIASIVASDIEQDDIDKAANVFDSKTIINNDFSSSENELESYVQDYLDEKGLPNQSGNENKFLKTDGINASWEQIDDNDIFVTANNLNKNLKDVIEDGDLDKVFQWPAFGDINAQIDLINEIKKLELPVGFVIEFAGNIPPANFLIANGQTISRTTYAELFAVIGTKYGAGDGSTTFNLPNLNNEFGRYTTNTSLVGNKHGHSTARPTTAFSTGAGGAHTHANTNSIENQLNFSGEVILPNGKDALSTTEDFIRSYSGNYLLLRDATALGSSIELTTGNTGTPNNVDFDLSSSTSSGSTSSTTHSHTITAGGDSETAPRHIMLLACIKVY